MTNLQDNNTFNSFLMEYKNSSGLAALGITAIPAIFPSKSEANFLTMPKSLNPYLTETAAERLNPTLLSPWAKSIIICAVPFAKLLPTVPEFFKQAPKNGFGGRIAGYAVVQDYHFEALKIMNNLVEELQNFLGRNFQFELFADTKPISEKNFALLCGIGLSGRNSCVLIPEYGSGCFLCGILCSEKLPEIKYQLDNSFCNYCNRCVRSCPNNVLENKNFRNCISYLSMEKRGFLKKSEREMLHNNIFGCDRCTINCPNTRLPKSYDVDLEWLLFESGGKLKKIIKQTALQYAGITTLRRNALAILENTQKTEAYELIKNFYGTTQSELLKKQAKDILTTQS